MVNVGLWLHLDESEKYFSDYAMYYFLITVQFARGWRNMEETNTRNFFFKDLTDPYLPNMVAECECECHQEKLKCNFLHYFTKIMQYSTK